MLRKMLSMLLCVLVLLSSVTCSFVFSVYADAENMIITPTTPTSLRETTAATRLTGWSRSSSGKAVVTTEDGYTVVSRSGIGNGVLFTNTFTVEKNSTYKFSFEIKAVDGTSFTYTNSSGETVPRGVNFVLNDFSVVNSDGSAYNNYQEGRTDYAHTNKTKYSYPAREGFSCTWTHELVDGSIYSEKATKYSSWGRKIGTSEAATALQTIDLNELYSDWRTVTCEFSVPDEDEYTASDIAIGFFLPADASNGGIYVRNVEMYKQVTPIADNTIATLVVDANGNEHSSADDIPVTTTAEDNGNGTYHIGITYDAMDGANRFLGWFNGDILLSNEESYTTAEGVSLNDITAKIQCNSVITGGLGFESYQTSTSLRVDPKQSGTPPYDDKWGIWSNYAKASGDPIGYENVDWDFDIKTSYGETTVSYAPEYDTEAGTFVTSKTTIKPYSGESMFYFAARSRSIVRKLDNLKPNTEYELSFYTYNLSKYDFLSKVTVSDTYDMKTGITQSNSNVKVYGAYIEPQGEKESGSNQEVIFNTDSVNNWNKISVNFTTDEDDTVLYLHLAAEAGNNSSSTSRQYVDNLTVCEVAQPESFAECAEFLGNSIRRDDGVFPQAMRYKFYIDEYVFKVYGDKGYTLEEYGFVVAKTDNLVNEDALIINGENTAKGVAYSKDGGIDVRFDTTDDGVIVSCALYNIGRNDNGVDYNDYNADFSVRLYAIYKDSEGKSHVYYDGMADCALFDVTDKILSVDTALECGNLYGKDSAEYRNYLLDFKSVRNIFDNPNAKSAYIASGREVYKENSAETCNITLTDICDNVALHTELQANYLADGYSNIAKYAGGTAELSRPIPVSAEFKVATSGSGVLLGYLMTISENPDLSNGIISAVQTTEVDIWNLKIGTKYYWNITAIYSDGIFVSNTDDFITDGTSPRNLYISGVTNVRDIGGWVIDGKPTNQGLIFRTGHLNNTTAKGQMTLFDELGIKSEIDIRLETEAKNTFGDKLNYYPAYMGYSGSILTSNHESIVKFFEVLGDESNYPIVYHCSIGTDRTGMMSFLLNGLLGATEEQLYRDYLFSNFGNIGASRDTWAIGSYLGYVNKCEGDTLKERIYNYLLGIGVEADDIDTYIRMMTE